MKVTYDTPIVQEDITTDVIDYQIVPARLASGLDAHVICNMECCKTVGGDLILIPDSHKTIVLDSTHYDAIVALSSTESGQDHLQAIIDYIKTQLDIQGVLGTGTALP